MKTVHNIVFFGTPDFSVTVLDHMSKAGFAPSLIITAPDRKIGRKQVLTTTPVKTWGQEHNIEVWQPENPQELVQSLNEQSPDLFVVAAYGYIISQEVLDIPKHGTLNVHTSLLPRFRGACPIESAILHADTKTGSTIMLMDAKMDHGPILTQESFELDPHINRIDLFETLANHGGDLLVRTIEPWIKGEITPQEQDHEQATFCYKITKADGDITTDTDATRYRKYLAYFGWPGVFFFDQDKKRVKITRARFEDGTFVIERIIPEGKKEMDYRSYLKS